MEEGARRTRRRFEQGCLAVQIGFVDHSQGDMVAAQKIFRLDSGKTQHLRNLVERRSLFAVAF